MLIKAVIFDCDGVLIDSEGVSARVLNAALARHGVEINFDYFCVNFVGRSFPTVAEDIRQSFNVDLPPDFEPTYRAELLAAFEHDLHPTAGIVPVLKALDLPSCVATSSSPERVARSLALTRLDRFFGGRVFTASEVKNGKPAPDLFLHAARSIGIDPQHCLVIEDSLPGIEAAQAAGMKVLRYTGGVHLKGRTLKHGTTVASFDNWRDFSVMLAGIEESGV